MISRAWRSQLPVAVVAVGAGILGEALASSLPRLKVSLLEAGTTMLLTLGLWVVPGALLAALVAALLAALCEEDALSVTLTEQWADARRREVLRSSLALALLFASWVYACARFAGRFRNLELAAALVALLALLGAGALASAGWVLLRRAPAQSAARWGLPLASVLGLGGVLWQIRGGLLQLDGRLWAAPLGFALALIAADRSVLVRSAGGKSGLVTLVVGLAAWATLLLAKPQTAASAVSRGPWSPALVGAVQRLSDFDGDDYSGLLGGGDCAPLDGRINPGALEVAGDGIDNNCIAGDGGKSAQPTRPRWGASAHGAPTNQNVVIVTIETLRQDAVSFPSLRAAARDTTPELRALARESLVFERMYSAAPLTRLSLAALFSSYAPSEIDWLPQASEKRMRRIGPATPWLPELLSARGYDTVAVLTDFASFTEQESAGFERGFARYDVSTKLSYRGGTMHGFPAAEQVDKAIAHIQQMRRPFLLWLHLFEPHYAYEQPPGAPVFGSDDRARYDAEIWHVDRQLGRLVNALRGLSLWDSTVLLVTGDHGEAFGEHGDRWHGSNLHDPQLRPAALLRVPGVPPKRIQQAVTFTDLAPTLTRVLGDRRSFDQLRGRSLTPLLHRSRLPEADASAFVVESFSVDDGRAYQAALIDYPLKLIYVEQGRRFSLFDLNQDPDERTPLDPLLDARGAPLLSQLTGYLERARPGSVTAPAPAP